MFIPATFSKPGESLVYKDLKIPYTADDLIADVCKKYTTALPILKDLINPFGAIHGITRFDESNLDPGYLYYKDCYSSQCGLYGLARTRVTRVVNNHIFFVNHQKLDIDPFCEIEDLFYNFMPKHLRDKHLRLLSNTSCQGPGDKKKFTKKKKPGKYDHVQPKNVDLFSDLPPENVNHDTIDVDDDPEAEFGFALSKAEIQEAHSEAIESDPRVDTSDQLKTARAAFIKKEQETHYDERPAGKPKRRTKPVVPIQPEDLYKTRRQVGTKAKKFGKGRRLESHKSIIANEEARRQRAASGKTPHTTLGVYVDHGEHISTRPYKIPDYAKSSWQKKRGTNYRTVVPFINELASVKTNLVLTPTQLRRPRKTWFDDFEAFLPKALTDDRFHNHADFHKTMREAIRQSRECDDAVRLNFITSRFDKFTKREVRESNWWKWVFAFWLLTSNDGPSPFFHVGKDEPAPSLAEADLTIPHEDMLDSEREECMEQAEAFAKRTLKVKKNGMKYFKFMMSRQMFFKTAFRSLTRYDCNNIGELFELIYNSFDTMHAWVLTETMKHSLDKKLQHRIHQVEFRRELRMRGLYGLRDVDEEFVELHKAQVRQAANTATVKARIKRQHEFSAGRKRNMKSDRKQKRFMKTSSQSWTVNSLIAEVTKSLKTMSTFFAPSPEDTPDQRCIKQARFVAMAGLIKGYFSDSWDTMIVCCLTLAATSIDMIGMFEDFAVEVVTSAAKRTYSKGKTWAYDKAKGVYDWSKNLAKRCASYATFGYYDPDFKLPEEEEEEPETPTTPPVPTPTPTPQSDDIPRHSPPDYGEAIKSDELVAARKLQERYDTMSAHWSSVDARDYDGFMRDYVENSTPPATTYPGEAEQAQQDLADAIMNPVLRTVADYDSDDSEFSFSDVVPGGLFGNTSTQGPNDYIDEVDQGINSLIADDERTSFYDRTVLLISGLCSTLTDKPKEMLASCTFSNFLYTMKETAMVARNMTAIVAGATMLLKALDFIITHLFGYNPLNPFMSSTNKTVDSFIDQCSDVKARMKSMVSSPADYRTGERLLYVSKGLRDMRVAERLDIGRRSALVQAYRQLADIKRGMVLYDETNQEKNMAVWVHMYGKPGVGKSAALPEICKQITKASGKEWDGKQAFQLDMGSDYVSGYKGEEIITCDEIGAIVDSESTREMMNYLNLVSSGGHKIEGAAVEEKTQTLNPLYLMTCTNSDTLNLKGVVEPAAFARRVAIYATVLSAKEFNRVTELAPGKTLPCNIGYVIHENVSVTAPDTKIYPTGHFDKMVKWGNFSVMRDGKLGRELYCDFTSFVANILFLRKLFDGRAKHLEFDPSLSEEVTDRLTGMMDSVKIEEFVDSVDHPTNDSKFRATLRTKPAAKVVKSKEKSVTGRVAMDTIKFGDWKREWLYAEETGIFPQCHAAHYMAFTRLIKKKHDCSLQEYYDACCHLSDGRPSGIPSVDDLVDNWLAKVPQYPRDTNLAIEFRDKHRSEYRWFGWPSLEAPPVPVEHRLNTTPQGITDEEKMIMFQRLLDMEVVIEDTRLMANTAAITSLSNFTLLGAGLTIFVSIAGLRLIYRATKFILSYFDTGVTDKEIDFKLKTIEGYKRAKAVCKEPLARAAIQKKIESLSSEVGEDQANTFFYKPSGFVPRGGAKMFPWHIEPSPDTQTESAKNKLKRTPVGPAAPAGRGFRKTTPQGFGQDNRVDPYTQPEAYGLEGMQESVSKSALTQFLEHTARHLSCAINFSHIASPGDIALTHSRTPGIIMCGTTMVVPAHFYMCLGDVRRVEYTVMSAHGDGSLEKKAFDIDDVTVVIDEESDLVALHFKKCRSFKDTKKHFYNEENDGTIWGRKCYLVRPQHLMGEVAYEIHGGQTTQATYNHHIGSKVHIPKSELIAYTITTLNGMCGSYIVGEFDGNLKVIAFHIGGNNSDGSGFGTPLNQGTWAALQATVGDMSVDLSFPRRAFVSTEEYDARGDIETVMACIENPEVAEALAMEWHHVDMVEVIDAKVVNVSWAPDYLNPYDKTEAPGERSIGHHRCSCGRVVIRKTGMPGEEGRTCFGCAGIDVPVWYEYSTPTNAQKAAVVETIGSLCHLPIAAVLRAPVSRSTAIKPSPYHGSLGPVTQLPSVKNPGLVDGIEVDPIYKAVLKQKWDTPLVKQDLMVEQAVNELFDAYGFDPEAKVRTWTEALEGFGALPPLAIGTSAGFEHKGTNGKRHLFYKVVIDGEVRYYPKRILIEAIEKDLELLKQGKRPTFLFTCFAKDETRPLKNIRVLKTRKVVGSDVVYNIIFKMYFGDIQTHFKRGLTKVGYFSGGINVHGTDWRVLYEKLQDPKCELFCGDFASFDTTVPGDMAFWFVDFVNKWYDDGEENARIRKILIQDCVDVFSVFDNKVVRHFGAHPSGSPVTYFYNCFISWVVTRSAIRTQLRRRNLEWMMPTIFTTVYGDDNVVKAPKGLLSGQELVDDVNELFGMTLTNPDKGPVVLPVEIKDVTFLGRKFRFNNGIMCAPLELDVIENSLYWWRRRDGNVLQQTVNSAFVELSHFDKNTFELYADVIQQHSATKTFGIIVPTYRQAVMARQVHGGYQ
uniref:Polyprotein n=1 Tax=Ulva picorna-like virus 5 TaxID=3051533 RepID=A0A9Y1YTB0_9VIRU|nr:MAG: polyprotein [Ulva picorna-like virus 5]